MPTKPKMRKRVSSTQVKDDEQQKRRAQIIAEEMKKVYQDMLAPRPIDYSTLPVPQMPTVKFYSITVSIGNFCFASAISSQHDLMEATNDCMEKTMKALARKHSPEFGNIYGPAMTPTKDVYIDEAINVKVTGPINIQH